MHIDIVAFCLAAGFPGLSCQQTSFEYSFRHKLDTELLNALNVTLGLFLGMVLIVDLKARCSRFLAYHRKNCIDIADNYIF